MVKEFETIILKRQKSDDKQTLGKMFCCNTTIYTLELADKNNQRRVSCIPYGTYFAKPHYSEKYKHCFWLQDVPERSEILIHSGNFHSNTLGCILVGMAVADINHDSYLDVISSRKALNKLVEAYPKGFYISIE